MPMKYSQSNNRTKNLIILVLLCNLVSLNGSFHSLHLIFNCFIKGKSVEQNKSRELYNYGKTKGSMTPDVQWPDLQKRNYKTVLFDTI